MKFLVDTNVVSEWVKLRPDPGVVDWMTEVDEDRVFISVISLAELRRGIERMPDGNGGADWMNGCGKSCRSDLKGAWYWSITWSPRLGEGLWRAAKWPVGL